MVRVIPRAPRLPRLAYPCPPRYLRLSRGLLLPFSPFATFPRAINSRAYTQVAPLFCQVHTGGQTPFGDSSASTKRAAGARGGGNDDRLSYANGSRQRARDDDGKKRLLRGRGADIGTHSAIRTLARWSSLATAAPMRRRMRFALSATLREPRRLYSSNPHPSDVLLSFCKEANLARAIFFFFHQDPRRIKFQF